MGEQTAAGEPAPEGGTAGSASAKVPPAAWPRSAPECPPKKGIKRREACPEL